MFLWGLQHMFQTYLAFQQFPLKVAIVYIPKYTIKPIYKYSVGIVSASFTM